MGRTIIVAPDSFKGTLTARQAAQAIREGLLAALPERAEDILLCLINGVIVAMAAVGSYHSVQENMD